MSPVKKTKLRRIHVRKRAVVTLKALIHGEADVYEAYRGLYGLWCANNAAVPELRPLFRIHGVEPDGVLSITESLRTEIRSLAAQILPSISE